MSAVDALRIDDLVLSINVMVTPSRRKEVRTQKVLCVKNVVIVQPLENDCYKVLIVEIFYSIYKCNSELLLLSNHLCE